MAVAKMQLEDWLDDLCVRFIINLPEEDLSSVARICFQIEEAQWFYEDFIRPLDPNLPSMTLRHFSLRIFQHCPLLAPFSVENHTRAFEEFLQYKTRVPVRGAILLNDAMDSTVLVKGWKKGANWSFPRGKINKDEDDLECAIREVYEETGYDLHAAGLVPTDRNVKHIEITMREQQMRLYVFRNVPMDTAFAPRTRKEISKIEWYKLSDLPAFRKKSANNQTQNDAAIAANANKFYMVAPFLVPLKKWVVQQKKREGHKNTEFQLPSEALHEEPVVEDDAWAQSHIPGSAKPSFTTTKQVPALDTLEGATKELQRLLKVQPTAELGTPTDASSDKGANLLAVLQAGSREPRATSGPNPLLTMGHKMVDTPRFVQPHQEQRPLPIGFMDGYHIPSAVTLHPYQVQHTWDQAPPGTQLQRQPHSVMPPVQEKAHTHLEHPQPLPPQVIVERGHFLGTPSPAQHRLGEPLHGGLRPQAPGTPNLVKQNQQQTRQLSSHSRALLDVLKTGSSSQRPENLPPFATLDPPSLGHQQHQAISAEEHIREGQLDADKGPGGRPNPVTPEQRATLLNMFNKKVSHIASESSHPAQFANKTTLAPEANAASIDNRATPEEGLNLQQNRSNQAVYAEAHTTASHNAAYQPPLLRTTVPSNQMSPPPVPSCPTVAGCASYDKPSSLMEPPSTSSLPNPAILQRKPSTSHEQRSKLLSLFGKTGLSGPEYAVDHVTMSGTDLVSPALASQQPAGSRPPSHLSESRRGSQTPISPADRNFLLNYLASATRKGSYDNK